MVDQDAPELLECRLCGNIAVGSGEVVCCDEPMQRADGSEVVEGPALAELLTSVFGMSDTELEICLCVMEAGDLTVQELADEIGYDRSVVSRHLNHLADLGVVEKRRQVLEQGGHTYIYRPVPPEQVRERLTAVFVTWVREGLTQLEALKKEKVESIPDVDEDPAWRIFRDA